MYQLCDGEHPLNEHISRHAVLLPSGLTCIPLISLTSPLQVSDFGLSRVLQSNTNHIKTQTFGTVTHVPPELLAKGTLTTKADVYAIGVLMWEIFTAEKVGGHAAMQCSHAAMHPYNHVMQPCSSLVQYGTCIGLLMST